MRKNSKHFDGITRDRNIIQSLSRMLNESTEEDVLKDMLDSHSSKIKSLLQGTLVRFNTISGNSNGIKWSGTLDNDIQWYVDTSSDIKVFFTMNAKGITTKLANAMKQLIAYMETNFVPAASSLQ